MSATINADDLILAPFYIPVKSIVFAGTRVPGASWRECFARSRRVRGSILEDDLGEVFRRLPNLSLEGLDKVSLRIQLLRGKNKTPLEYDWLLEGIVGELRRRGLWSAGVRVSRAALSPSYESCAESIRAYLLRGVNKESLKSSEKLALGILAASALIAFLVKARVPITLKTVFQNVDKIPVAIETSFPGYWAAGLLAFCLVKPKA